jgi:hypothetical protein
MSTWYQSKVKYGLMVDGKVKTVSELYLHEAVNFGEVEKHCYENLRTRIKYPNVDAIAKSTYGEVVFYAGTRDEDWDVDPFYKIGIETGEKYTYLIPAKDADEAIARTLKAHGYGERKQIFEIKRTDVLAIWHPHNELWQGDWWNRMERLLEAKKCSWDLNQTEIPFDPEPTRPDNEQPESDPNAITAMVVRSGVESVEAEDLGNGYDGESGTMEPVRELPEGSTKLIEAPEETEPAEA